MLYFREHDNKTYENIRNRWRKERNMVLESKRSGARLCDIYKLTWDLYNSLSFL